MATDQDIQTLKNSLQEIETKTGKKYQLTLHEEGQYHDKGLVICSFKERNKYIVYDMDDNHQDLAGTYDSYANIEKKIQLLRMNNAKDFKKDGNSYIWQCPECDHFERNYSWNSLCQNHNQHCRYSLETYYEDVHLDLHSSSIYTAGGGSISICHDIGKIKIA